MKLVYLGSGIIRHDTLDLRFVFMLENVTNIYIYTVCERQMFNFEADKCI